LIRRTTENGIKMSDILVGAFLLGLFAMALTVVVYSAATAFFEETIEEMLSFMLSLVVSLQIVGLILILYLS
jgi:uncharacterized BrkB/YihY/UPF0761 family membrane protein